MAVVTTVAKIVVALASAAYTYYANKKMLKDLKRKPIQDDRPSTTTTRGAFAPILIGRRRLAPIVAWLSDRAQSGGSVFESAGHIICVGPADFLHKVLENGKPILSSVLSRTGTPSGTTIQTSNGRSFRIYWGDADNELDPSVPSEIGSFFPNICYIFWDNILVGPSGSLWPEFTYDIETAAKSNPEGIPTAIVGRPPTTGEYSNILGTENGFPGVNYVDTVGDRTNEFSAGENAAIRFDTVSEDMTQWEFSEDTSFVDPINTLQLSWYIFDPNKFMGEARESVFPFPSQGNSVRISFDVFIAYTRYKNADNENYIDFRFEILDNSNTPKYYLKNVATPFTLPGYKPEDASDGMSFSKYIHSAETGSDPSLYGWTHYDVVVTAIDNSIKFDTWKPQFRAVKIGPFAILWTTGTAQVQNIFVDTAVEIDVRRAYLANLGESISTPDDLSSWDTVEDTYGTLSYLPSTDPDYIAPPAEVTSLNQNRLEVPDPDALTTIKRSVSATQNIATQYPNKVDSSFYLYAPYSELEITFQGTTLSRTFSLTTENGDLTWGSEVEDGTFDIVASELEGWHKISVSDLFDQPQETFSIKVTLTHTYVKADIRIQDLSFSGLDEVTRIELNEEVNFLTDNTGEVAPRIPAVIGGANAAGAIYQLLFEKYPYGAGLDPADYDLDSLSGISDLLTTEVVPVSILADDGKDLEAILANLLQDIGVMMYWNVSTGKWTFKAEREPTAGEVQDIDLIDQFPQVSVDHDDALPNQVIFSFSDVNRKYKETTLLHDNDGEIAEGYGTTKRTQSVRIPSVIDFETAKQIAERRAQEVLGTAISYQFKSGRRDIPLNPGDVVKINGEDPELRVLSVQDDPDSNLASVNAVTEFYGVPSVDSGQGEGGTGGTNAVPAPDISFDIIEVPRSLSSNVNALYVPRIRPDSSTLGAFINVSTDGGTSYANLDSTTVALAGGDLVETLRLDARWNDSVGVKFRVEGPDALDFQDLTSQSSAWRSGAQIAIIGEEWMFVRKVEVLSSTVFQLTGVLRGRYSSEKVRHAAGEQLYILASSDMVPINFTSSIGDEPFIKSQPYNENGSVDLSAVTPESKEIIGDGTIPPRPYGINTPEGSKSWVAGTDVDVSWSYRNGLSTVGAGEFNAGVAVASASPEGMFTLTILDTGDIVKDTITDLTTPDYTITNATLVSLFGGEPTAFKIKITNTSTLGLISRSTEETLTRV